MHDVHDVHDVHGGQQRAASGVARICPENDLGLGNLAMYADSTQGPSLLDGEPHHQRAPGAVQSVLDLKNGANHDEP